MPDEMNAIKSLPDISFIDNKTIDQVRKEMVADYESFISEATGQTVSLERSSVHRMELYAAAAQIYQAMQYIDRQGKTIRPMTDLVRVAAPQEVQYTINLTYYINRSDSAKAVTIQAEVAKAVDNYKTWQRAIGRDINPSQLVRMVMDAGAKRVTVTEPEYTAVDATKVSALQGDAVINYGGLEDD